MEKEFINIIKKLISFETTPGNFDEITKCFDYIDKELDFYPFSKKTYIHNKVESRIWSTSQSKTVEFILNAHIDVVPANEQLFKLKLEKNKILGRGVSDMKYAVAIYILILKKIYEESGKLPSLCLMITSDEENGGLNGVKHLLDQGYRGKMAFVPDGGENNKIVENAKGVIHFDINSKGIGAHGARLWEGKDSIEPLAAALLRIRKKFPFPNKKVWKTTINLGRISGGIQTNQVASESYASIDVRFIPNDKPSRIEKMIKNLVGACDLRKTVFGSAFRIDRNNDYISKWKGLLNAQFINEDIASDGRYFVEYGIPTIVSKPVGGLIHNSGEWTDVNSCLKFGSSLKQLIINS